MSSCCTLFLALTCISPACHLSFQWIWPFPSPSAPGDCRSDHPIARYVPSKSHVSNFSPFSVTWKIHRLRTIDGNSKIFGRSMGKLWAETLRGGGGGGGVVEGMFLEGAGGPWGMEREIIGL